MCAKCMAMAMAMRILLLMAKSVFVIAEFGAAAASACDAAAASAATCFPSPLNCSSSVAQALATARFLDSRIITSTSPQQPAIVMPVIQARGRNASRIMICTN